MGYRNARWEYSKTPMRRLQIESKKLKPAHRIVLGIVGLMITLGGVSNVLMGTPDYTNYRGLLAFAPFSIVIGSLVVLIAFKTGK
jgi:hypothetical protein